MIYFMGEALIIRSGGGSQSSGGYVPKTVLINSNQTWTVPKAKNQEFMVRIFGGGGGGATYSESISTNNYGGGGGGNMNNALLKLNEGDVIDITIGSKGNDKLNRINTSIPSNGGTTSFGTYLSATGGEASNRENGGNGGTGGGAALYFADMLQESTSRHAGDGTYGGGGGGFLSNYHHIYSSYNRTVLCYTDGGTGGNFGGGGAFTNNPISVGGYGIGSTGNLNGGLFNYGTNGLNTINKSTELDFVGKGLLGDNFGGGGGYGGCGGKSGVSISTQPKNSIIWSYAIGGGGGGYGGNGGDVYFNNGKVQHAAGGGGGYGNDGADGCAWMAGGGGGYGPEGYGHGGGGVYKSGNFASAKSGVCIITYMEPVQ